MKLTPEEIIEGNKLIDHFFKEEGYKLLPDYFEITEDFVWLRKIRYHDSWEWTMPVVTKINGLGKAFSLAIFKNYISLTVEKSGNKFYKDFSFSHSEYITGEQTGKEAMFKLLVKFIKWHNQQVASTNLETAK